MTTKISDLRLVAFCLAELISIYIEWVGGHGKRPGNIVYYIVDLKVERASAEAEKKDWQIEMRLGTKLYQQSPLSRLLVYSIHVL